jgi:uncharacterized protein YyaL (SSP411 family)
MDIYHKDDPRADEAARILRLRELDKSALPPDGGPHFNRLIFAGSPYLLQHAENPVDWHPWGDEAFARAQAEDKPILLSIGYATCHWCHVMAHESFEDAEVAEVVNRLFVPIKVDREEHPDIDEQYMTAAQLMGQGGGWPLNVFLTPDRKPFFAATYLPRTALRGMPGILAVLTQIGQAWQTQKREIERHSASVIKALRELKTPAAGPLPGEYLLNAAFRELDEIHDTEWGGFGSQPKFPMPLYLSLLLHDAARTGSSEALAIACRTLRKMRWGGIYDQLGYGFHRYSVDREWRVPHFEKMLYDQALLSIVYLQAFRITGERFFSLVAEEILNSVLRDLAAPDGGFFAALDADSQGKEGVYYLWTRREVERALGAADADLFSRFFGMQGEPPLEDGYVLWVPLPLAEFARSEGLETDALRASLGKWREKLLAIRNHRIRPLRDEKRITAWNGLMIAALANGYGAVGRQEYLDGADAAVSFILQRQTMPDGRLMRIVYPNSGIEGLLEDHAFFVWGLIELYVHTLDNVYLKAAVAQTREMLARFGDPAGPGFFTSRTDADPVLVRSREGTDGVIPSGYSVAVMNLLRLGRITACGDLVAAGEAALKTAAGRLDVHPLNHAALLMSCDFLNTPAVECSVSGDPGSPEGRDLLSVLSRRYIPGLLVRRAETAMNGASGSGTSVSICSEGACRPPVTDPLALEALLDKIAPRMTTAGLIADDL